MKYKDRMPAKRKYKQALLATVATMAIGVSTLGSTTSAFAAENTANAQFAHENGVASQGRAIQGYLFKDGVKAPVYKLGGKLQKSSSMEDIPFPRLPSNPEGLVPKHGSIKSEVADIGSTLYFSRISLHMLPESSFFPSECPLFNVYAEKRADGSIEVGNFDPKTLAKSPLKNYSGEIIRDWSLSKQDSELIKSYFSDTKVKRETSFQLLKNLLLPKYSKYTHSEAIKSGMSTENAIGGTLTLGYKLTTKVSGDILVAKAEVAAELSAQLSASYNHKVVVTDETTRTDTIEFPGVKNNTYKYNQYMAALYQLKSTYNVQPSPTLQKAIDNGKAVLAQKSFSYSDSTTYLTVTPGAGD
ncbi:TPA: hypothetical protein QCU24_005923 [Bacillus cereus]|nr:hypothetical protein [Bacillus cereus]